ncbi:MAG: LacI family DNA-binding transcriptional regulator [Burkholderiales bacterium]|jgi:LacI family transcriptional regulator|nr:LacI family DNA-binding transcriptional regulator [Burkholderiales bacterium]
MNKAPRIHDIAHLAGVSTATVDRVLNQRSGVRAATVQRVLQAAAQLDYRTESGLVSSTPALPAPMRLAFLLPAGQNRFIRMLGDMVNYSQEHWTPFNVRCRTEFIESFNPIELADAVRRHGQRADGIALMALEHPAVREAVAEVAASGVPVITLISDLSNSPRTAYLGLDNRAAGRTAGYLIGRFIGPRPAKVALIAGSRSYRAHEEREAGFLHVLSEMFGQLEVVGLREGHDDSEQNYAQTRSLLDQHPQLAGIYNVGGASDGVARALKDTGRDQKVVFVGHGLTPDTRALLIDGSLDAVITQSPQATLASAVRIFVNVREGRPALSGVESTRGQVIFRENLP